jgi:hypothetical protein
MQYLVVQSFASTLLGGHSEGEVLELTDAQAKDLLVFLQPIEEAPAVETADLPVEHVEKAVASHKRKKKEA